MTPLLSIVVPVYNVEKYLVECIDSILNQPYKDCEIILVNDGSTDRSLDICLRYEAKDPRIIVVNKRNGGLSSARNCGIEKAKGKYISFIDSDDYLEGDYYSEAIDELEKNQSLDVVWLQYVKETEGGKRKYYSNPKQALISYSKNTLLNILTSKESFAWLKVYRAVVFSNIRYPEGKILEDMYILPELLDNIRSCKIIPINGYYIYRQREGSICHTKHTYDMLHDIALASARKIAMCINVDRGIYIKMLATYSSAYLNARILEPDKDWSKLIILYESFIYNWRDVLFAKISFAQKIKLLLIKFIGYDGILGVYRLIYNLKRRYA